MAQYNVDHTCGHSETHQLYGKSDERDRKLAWLETTDCGACYHAKVEAARAAQNAAATEKNQLAGLVPLAGSDKQVAWAESIRSPVCAALDALEADLETRYRSPMSAAAWEEMRDAMALVIDEVRAQASARWWIDEGRDLAIASVPDAYRYAANQIRDRGLAPTALREAKEEEARREAEAEALRTSQAATLAGMLAGYESGGIPAEGLEWDPASGAVSGTVAGHSVRCEGRGYNAPVSLDGVPLVDPGPLRTRLQRWSDGISEARRLADREVRCDALAGAAVASVAKAKQKLTVTLADGRVLTGTSDRSGWSLAYQSGSPGWEALDPNHPEVERITKEARAWAKKAGVK